MPRSPHIKVLLFRAGLNDWDRTGRLSGSVDLPLCPQGEAAVEAAIRELEPGCVGKIRSAPEESAEATAGLLGARLEVKPRTDPDLHEVGLGRWEGMSRVDAEGRYATAYRQWREDPTAVVPAGGETVQDGADRIIAAMRDVLSKCRADESCGVCFVLRPMAFGIARCWLQGLELTSLWSVAESVEMHEWFVVQRASLRFGGMLPPTTVRDAS